MSHKIPAEIVLKQINETNDRVEIISEYKFKAGPLRVRCKDCGFEWDTTANRLLFGHGCRKCSGMKKRGVSIRKKSNEEYLAELSQKNPNVRLLSEYQNARVRVECECAVCGHQWTAKPFNLLTGFGCPMCANVACSQKQTKSEEDFRKEFYSIHKDIEIIGKYRNNRSNIELMCKDCGMKWYAMPVNLLRRDGKATGCPHCKKSHGEGMIASILGAQNIEYKQWKKFDGLVGIGGRPLSYDFYIPSLNLLIEYQGEFHDHTSTIQTDEDYESQVEHDRRKREYARNHNIRLLEIWYYDNLEEKLMKELSYITDPVTTTAS